jgi:anaerobic magnesium-protoporphyrin IX monomethyl ester cyclase
MKILFTTLHAKFVHSSLALPYLAAFCKDIDGVETAIREFTVNEHADHVLRRIVTEKADVVAFSCYIWNIEQTLRLASDLKKITPATRIILGGPEVSHNPDEILSGNEAVDCIIRGDGEEVFRNVISTLKQVGSFEDAVKSIHSGLAYRAGSDVIVRPIGTPVRDLDAIPSPFAAGLVDMKKPLVYYETSRGCPFSCAFCMSSLENGVRSFSMERIREDLMFLMDHEAATVKLVDRTFNYDADRANEIWDFILRNNRSSRFHFEIAADLLTEENIRMLAMVPEGMFRFEIGVQSGDTATLATVGRKTNLDKLFANVEKLRTETGVIIHLDLIAGLPNEGFAGFLSSLQQLFAVGPHHIQVEPLKVLKGSPMREIAEREGYFFSTAPPYKILRTPYLSFDEITRIETISRLIDIYYNSGRFRTVLEAVARLEPLSLFFDTISAFVEKHAASGAFSQRGNFGLIRDFMGMSYPEETLESLNDALCYDFCLCEYPSAGNFPLFLKAGGNESKAGTTKTRNEMATLLEIEPGSKVRTFTHRFRKNYACLPWKEEPTEITFAYISAPGKGLRVKPVTATQKAVP